MVFNFHEHLIFIFFKGQHHQNQPQNKHHFNDFQAAPPTAHAAAHFHILSQFAKLGPPKSFNRQLILLNFNIFSFIEDKFSFNRVKYF